MIGIKKKNIKGYSISEEHRYLYLPNHPKSKPNGYYAEHRYLFEQRLGRILNTNEIIHHINGGGLDNRLENLEILTCAEHAKKHYSSKRMIDGRKEKYKTGWNPSLKGSNNPNWNGGKVRKICKCGKEFFVFPCKLKNGRGKY